jgi:hypothetical protein
MKIVSSITRPEGSSESKGARAKASNVTFSKHTRTILHDHHEECMNISFLLVGQAKKITKLYLLDGFISQTPMSHHEECMNISFLLVGQAKKITKLYLLDGFISQTPMSREEEAEIKP